MTRAPAQGKDKCFALKNKNIFLTPGIRLPYAESENILFGQKYLFIPSGDPQ
jgi:hypothetical protein